MIRLHDKLLIPSEHSMNSPWVKTEIANAREREKRKKKQMLFPITLAPLAKVKAVESCSMPTAASTWHARFASHQKAFHRLVKI